MARFNWEKLLEQDGDEILTFLQKVEDGFLRAIKGIWVFISKKIPEFAQTALAWLQEKCVYACRVAIRVGRVLGLFIAWALIAFGPIAIYPGIITGLWIALALAGSIWGVQREIKKKPARLDQLKGAIPCVNLSASPFRA